MAFQTLLLDDCNSFRTHLLGSFFLRLRNVTIFHHCCINFTGCLLNNVLFIKLLSSPSKYCITGNPHTWLILSLHNVLLVTCVPTLRTCFSSSHKTTIRRSFAFSAPHIWNSLLSPELRACRTLSSFRHLLKTHLYPYHPP